MAAPQRTILVVDDEPVILRIYQAWLSGAGYEVLEASTCAEALALLATHGRRIAMVITDWQLEIGTSAALIAHACAQHPPLPIICVSGSFDGALPIRLLTKPIDCETLLAAIELDLPFADS